MMSRIIFDIETVGDDFNTLENEIKEYLLKWTETEEDVATVKESLGFYPHTGQIVAIGLINPDTEKGAIYFQSHEEGAESFEEDGVKYQVCTEREILINFWKIVNKYEQIITFNGRSFDCPFILIRSALHNLRPSRELLPSRYNNDHIDLLDRLTFFGAFRKKFSLDIWCRTFGIKSPKSDGISGYEVKDLFNEGKYLDIARYCVGDLRATRELFQMWKQYIKFPPER